MEMHHYENNEGFPFLNKKRDTNLSCMMMGFNGRRLKCFDAQIMSKKKNALKCPEHPTLHSKLTTLYPVTS